MALIVFLGIAYCGWTGGHIAVDVFSKWLDRPSLRYLPSILSFVGAALFALIAYRATLETIATIDQVVVHGHLGPIVERDIRLNEGTLC